MKRALISFALGLAACSSTTTPVATGQFVSPSGITATSAGDRDLVFIANEGRDGLRALQLCLAPLDGGAGVPCPANEDLQFVPAPIRIFPATIETGDRPRRLAGVRLSRADQSTTGAVLAVGADDTMRMVDARNLVDTADGGTALPVLSFPVDSPAADVVAENPLDATAVETSAPPGQTVTAFVATLGNTAAPAQLRVYQVGVDSQGGATVATLTGQCTLAPVVPRKLAAIPGGGDRVYVADGAGDGVVAIAKAGVPAPSATPAACPMDRIGAGGRAARSLSVSGPWTERTTDTAGNPQNTPHPAGELLIMVLEPLPVSAAGVDLDPGGILIVRTADKTIVPIPPFGLFDPVSATAPSMQPIAPPALPREVTFLRAIPPGAGCAVAPCTPIYIGYPTTAPTPLFSLLAAVTSTDGGTYFIDVIKRRLVNVSYYQFPQTPFNDVAPVLSPSTGDPNPPVLKFLDVTDVHPEAGWYTSGVTHSARLKIVWHGPFPGLETRGGTLTPSGHGTLLLKLPALDLTPWETDPALQLAVGDTASFSSYTVPAGSPQPCTDLVSSETASRFDLPIVSLPATDTLELAPLAATTAVRGFDLTACPTGLGVVAAVRTGGAKPWLVFDNATARGRLKNGDNFSVAEPRFDYPLDYTAAAPPLPANDVAVAFKITGDDPTVLGSTLSFGLSANMTPQSFRDGTLSQGLATSLFSYSSTRYPQLVFSSITGSNAVVQADPSEMNQQVGGIVSYK